MSNLVRILSAVVAILFAIAALWIASGQWSSYQIAVERRALDARAAELVQRTLAPGSALACLDATASTAVELACEKALFASPKALAAAVAYVDAKMNLLADSIAHAARDQDYEAHVERLRHGLESDRFGLVAQALTARGCTAEACETLALFRNPWRIVTNLKERTFDIKVALYASAWRPGSEALAATLPPAVAPSAPGASVPNGVPVASKYDFPSAASIPPVSIMDAEPPLSKQEQAAIAAPPATTSAAPAATTPQRRPSPNPATQPVPLPVPVPAQR